MLEGMTHREVKRSLKLTTLQTRRLREMGVGDRMRAGRERAREKRGEEAMYTLPQRGRAGREGPTSQSDTG